jgi:cardiolipin synthase A/B
MKQLNLAKKTSLPLLKYLCIFAFCWLLTGCNLNVLGNASPGGQCLSNCSIGTGVNGLGVIVEPDAGISPLVNAIREAKTSVWLEIYLLTNKSIIGALEDDANRGIDVRVMLEPHPAGSGSVAPSETLDKLKAAGVKAQFSDPDFTLTHEKGMIIDNSTIYIMTTNFTSAALGTGNGTHNREYDIVITFQL